VYPPTKLKATQKTPNLKPKFKKIQEKHEEDHIHLVSTEHQAKL